jgi:hypothetical protein
MTGTNHAPAAAAAPPLPEAVARALAGLAARLADLMIRETALLGAGRSGEIAVLQSEKRDLARAYAGRWAQLKNHSGAELLPPELLSGLRVQLARLDRAAAENAAALRIMLNATSRVIGIVAAAVREEQASISGYDGRRARPRRQPAILGVACNRQF